MISHRVTESEAKRTKHVAGCAGYEDCVCFSSNISHADFFKLQRVLDAAIAWRNARDRRWDEELELMHAVDALNPPNAEPAVIYVEDEEKDKVIDDFIRDAKIIGSQVEIVRREHGSRPLQYDTLAADALALCLRIHTKLEVQAPTRP